MSNDVSELKPGDIVSIKELPADIQGVAISVLDSFIDIWSNFIGHTPYIVGAIVVLFITWIVSISSAFIGRRALKRNKMRGSIKDLILRFITLGIWSLGLLFSAMILFPGLTPAKALGGLGLVSIAVGLAFKDIFENFFAGILLLWRFPFEKGDYIECEGIVGRVEEILIRMTSIRKDTGELVVVPNSFLFKNPVDVLTNQNSRRVRLEVGIAYDEDVNNALQVISEALTTCTSIISSRPIQIWPFSFGSSSIDIEVTWWTDAKPVDLRSSRGEVITAIKKALDDAGIEIPYPYRTLTFKEPIQTQEVANKN